MPAARGYIPNPQDLAVLEAASALMGNKYKRAPRNQQAAVKRAYAILGENFKLAQKDDFNALQTWMLESITYYTKLKQEASVDGYIPEDPAVVDAFNLNHLGPGPLNAEGALKLDFRVGASFEEGWNRICIDLIVSHILEALNSTPPPLRPVLPDYPEVYLLSATINKMKSFQRNYKLSRTRGQETVEEACARAVATRSAANEKNKLSGRRSSLFSSRLDIIARMQNKFADKQDTVDLWGSLGSCVRTLGIDGMSDDEEDEDGTQPYKVMSHPWRNPEIAEWMEFIDLRYYLIKAKTGSAMRRRTRKGSEVSSREVVLNLPPWFYSAEFRPMNTLTTSTSAFTLSRTGLGSMEGLTEKMMRQRMAAQ